MYGVAPDADAGTLPKPRRRELVHGLIGQRPGTARQSDTAVAVDIPGHDADLAFAGADDAGTVGSYE